MTLIVGEAEFADKNIKIWTVTATKLSLSGDDAGNYTLLTDTATDTATITALELTISDVVAKDKIRALLHSTVNASIAGLMHMGMYWWRLATRILQLM